MRTIAATLAFDGHKWLKRPMLSLNDENKIISVKSFITKKSEPANTEFYSGILTPGFINSHVHTELSFTNSTYTEENGISDFINYVREFRKENKYTNPTLILRKLKACGTKAIADICNSDITFKAKSETDLFSINFFEFYGLSSEKINDQLETYQNIINNFNPSNFYPSIHSPYTITKNNLSFFKSVFKNSSKLTSMHFRESLEELLLFKHKGKLYDLYKQLNNNYEPFNDQIPFDNNENLLNNIETLLLIHNTFIYDSDIRKIIRWKNLLNKKILFVLCPRSNKNITGNVPDLDLLLENKLDIALGTDSLLSSPDISVFNELIYLSKLYPQIKFGNMLKWITSTPAKYLDIDQQFGSFETGKNPGINLITGKNISTDKVPENFSLKNLV